ncbi:Glycerate kinase [Leucobacter sp. 7(1)]|uniref:glycerate kinase n=1 Tax=Leucobacter sp. 7(1) TaxID=1255613 RepID=UPI00097F5C78|nr:glycerate kinase [Leucobacter sp. 7(1)]SJN08828.1 Glycerate kinase [Leucobacter sp. 7(1)]
MRIVIAPDKFKGSLTAAEVCEAITRGIATVNDAVSVVAVPMADGGEGTLDAAVEGGFTQHAVPVSGPLGDPVIAHIGVRDDAAVVEMALASGLALVPEARRDALAASSQGTGECILAALNLGAQRISLAIGGSASTDGGAGMLQALGARFTRADGTPLARGGGPLVELASVDLSGLDPRLAATQFVVANDVSHELLGEHGAARVFGPQKGATPADVTTLEAGLTTLVSLLDQVLPGSARFAAAPGAGAAGGVGYAALAVLGAEQQPGTDIVIALTGLDTEIAQADLVITGEGSLDHQSLAGKTPVGVARAAAAHGVPVVAVCGRTTLAEAEWRDAGFVDCYAVAERAPDSAASMRDAAQYLEHIGSEIARAHLATPHPR